MKIFLDASRDIKRQKSQTEIAMYFYKVLLHVSDSRASHFTPPPLLPLSLLTQQDHPPLPPLSPHPTPEDTKDEDLYDNPLPLNE